VYSISFVLLLTILGIGPVSLDSKGDHAIYISVVEINHNQGDEMATIKVKVFTNDMEDALKNAFNKNISLMDASACNQNKTDVERYFMKHFSYSVNDKLLDLRLTTCESNGDAIWFHFQIDCPSQWKEVSITADYLMELFPTQSNVVSIHHGDQKRFLRITKSESKGVVTF